MTGIFSASCDGRDISHRSFATKENLQLNSRSSRRQNKLVPPDVQENPGLLTEKIHDKIVACPSQA